MVLTYDSTLNLLPTTEVGTEKGKNLPMTVYFILKNPEQTNKM